MRENLFRGKKCNGEWTYGYYVQADYSWHDYGKHKEWIVCSACANGGWFALQEKHAVIPETIGQYTGLTDKNGKKIFEGDICEVTVFTCEGEDKHFLCEVCFEYSSFIFRDLKRSGLEILFSDIYDFKTDVEVIGNIYDNPELIGGTNNG